MDEQKKPRSREKKVVSEGKGVQKYGEGLGTGPVGNAGEYADRREQQAQQSAAAPQRPAQNASRPQQNASPFAATQSSGRRPSPQPQQQRPPQGASPFAAPHSSAQRPAAQPQQQRPQQGASPFAAPHTSGQRPAAQPQQQRPQQSASPFAAPHSSGQRPASSSQAARPQQRPSATPQNAQRSSTVPQGNGTRRAGGGGSKLIMIVIALAVLFGGGKISGLFGGDDSGDIGSLTNVVSSVVSGTTNTGNTNTGTQTSGTTGTASSGSDNSTLGNLLSSLLTSGGNSVYDFGGSASSLLSAGSTQSSAFDFFTNAASTVGTSASASTAKLDTTVAKGARAKRTALAGSGKDTVTILVYMCGTDLESQNGMGTSDLKEMANATLSDQVSVLVYTGGCKRWKNSVVSSSVNQIYQIRKGGLYCLEKDMGSASMTRPETLASFIQYGVKNYPANRMCLILWDHGGGSISGYGYDEKNASGGSMSLAGINTALKNGGATFDFVGFDACLMATTETALMLSRHADYLIGSEETEPGVGWYYTNWLTALSENTSMPTIEIGKRIADDFVEVCNRQCRGQATTLSVVDLAELETTLPAELKAFSSDMNQLIQNREYKQVSKARSNAREFAQSTRIDQVDLIHFARNLGTEAGEKLAKAVEGAVKYNRTGGGMTNAHGLSIYFPYRRTNKVNQMVNTYAAIGMDEAYTRCIQEFASMEVSGQVVSGTSLSNYGATQTTAMPGLLDALMGSSGGGYNTGISSSYGSSDSMMDLLGGLFGGTSSGGAYSSGSSYGSMLDLFSGRTLTAETAVATLSAHHFDPAALVWQNGRITLSPSQWDEVESLSRNVFVDDGSGYIDLGLDTEFTLEGNDLVGEFDGTWISLNGQPMAYYHLGSAENGEEEYVISGYTPALLNGVRVNLMINFDNQRPYGYIAGAEIVYASGETESQAKNLIQIGEGDQIQLLCDYYDYEGKYQDTYRLGQPFTLGAEVEIANTHIGDHPVSVTFCFIDYYQQRYWTPALT